MGEPTICVVAPSVLNAIHAATVRRDLVGVDRVPAIERQHHAVHRELAARNPDLADPRGEASAPPRHSTAASSRFVKPISRPSAAHQASSWSLPMRPTLKYVDCGCAR